MNKTNKYTEKWKYTFVYNMTYSLYNHWLYAHIILSIIIRVTK